jgi:hypothetical protein
VDGDLGYVNFIFVEGKAACPQPAVVTGDAVAVEQRTVDRRMIALRAGRVGREPAEANRHREDDRDHPTYVSHW